MHVASILTAEHYTWGDGCDGWHLLRGEELSVIQERMPPKTSEVAHFHTRSRQFFYVISGTLSILLAGKLHRLAAEQGLEVAPKVTHRVLNESGADVRFIVISTPPSHGDRVIAA
jgi:mannose-6-phosphate isomerase-like protein (cupin superfamily)